MALLLIYLILAAQFESFGLIPLLSCSRCRWPLPARFMALYIFGQTTEYLSSQIGMIMLIGLVIENGILIVEFANQKREEGMIRLDAACWKLHVYDFVPILMTPAWLRP